MRPTRFIALLSLLLPAASLPGADHPNILFIMADQHRADCLGAAGNTIIKTPSLDRLAAGSAFFTHAFVQAPVCVPSRASFFTGRYPHSHKNRVNYTPLDRREQLMPAILRGAGYATALIGKTHLYYDYPPTAEAAGRTGFDIVELHDGVGGTDPNSAYTQWRNAHDPTAKTTPNYRAYAKQHPPAGQNPFRSAIEDAYSDTTWTGQTTRRHLTEMAKSDKPFFIFSSFWKPHTPWEVPVPFDSMYSNVTIPLARPVSLDEIHTYPEPLQKLALRGKGTYDMDRTQMQWAYRSYYAGVSYVDREVGLILDELEKTGKAANTIIIYSSDHGEQLIEHGILGKNCFYEASVRVPLMISYPGHVAVKHYDELVEAVDVLPTALEFAGLDEPIGVQGQSLVPLIAKNPPRPYQPRQAVFSENVIPEVITTRQKMEFAYEPNKGVAGIRHPDAKMVRTDRWKLNYYANGQMELYDLKADPNEDHNLAADPAHRETVLDLKQRLLDWLITADETDQIAPRWLIP